jgi:hypothetical protein
MDLTEKERTAEDKRQAFVYKLMNLRVPYNAGKILDWLSNC